MRQFACSQGKAKTDKLDAEMIAQYALASKLEPFQIADRDLLRLRELNTRRSQAISMLNQEENRLEHKLSRDIERLIKKNIRSYEKEIKQLDEMLEEFILEKEGIKKKIDLIASMPGVGIQTGITVLCELPELGTLDRSRVAAITGLAPFNRDSGTYSGRRKTNTSRPKIKSVLFMCAMSAIRCNPRIKSFYNRLKNQGKPGKLVLVASMRKMIITLNSMVAKEKFWTCT